MFQYYISFLSLCLMIFRFYFINFYLFIFSIFLMTTSYFSYSLFSNIIKNKFVLKLFLTWNLWKLELLYFIDLSVYIFIIVYLYLSVFWSSLIRSFIFKFSITISTLNLTKRYLLFSDCKSFFSISYKI